MGSFCCPFSNLEDRAVWSSTATVEGGVSLTGGPFELRPNTTSFDAPYLTVLVSTYPVK